MHDETPRPTDPVGPEYSGLRRMQPDAMSGLDPEEISERPLGNCLFSFGFPGSGKTTLQWMLMNYLMNEGPFHTTIHVPQGAEGKDWEGRRIINEWKDQWVEGRFPQATQSEESDIREISINAKTTQGKKLSVDFNFLEVSGELLRMVLPEKGEIPRLAPTLRAYFENPRLTFTVMLMLHPDVEENDKLFPSFMSYLDQEFPGLRERMSLGVIISKPEASLAKLNTFKSSHGRSGYTRFNAEALEDYLNRFCGETFQIWETWPNPKKTLLSPLYIGNTTEIAGEVRLKQPDFKHIEQIFLWTFEQFHLHGKRPGPTFWERMRGELEWR